MLRVLSHWTLRAPPATRNQSPNYILNYWDDYSGITKVLSYEFKGLKMHV